MLQSSTQGNIRPLGPRLFGSPLALHKSLPHTPQSPCHIYRSDTALGSISDCWSRSFHFLCRYLHETEQQSVLWLISFQLAVMVKSIHHYGVYFSYVALLIVSNYQGHQEKLSVSEKTLF